MKRCTVFAFALVLALFLGVGEVYAQDNLGVNNVSSPLNKKVNVNATDIKLSSLLGIMSSQTKIKFLMGGNFNTKNVTVHLKDGTIKEVLDSVLPSQGLGYEVVDEANTIVIVKRTKVFDQENADTNTQKEDTSLWNRKVTIRVSNVPLRTLLNSLTIQMRQRINLIADPSVSEMRITLKASDITCREALELVSQRYSLRYYKSDDNTYVFTR